MAVIVNKMRKDNLQFHGGIRQVRENHGRARNLPLRGVTKDTSSEISKCAETAYRCNIR